MQGQGSFFIGGTSLFFFFFARLLKGVGIGLLLFTQKLHNSIN